LTTFPPGNSRDTEPGMQCIISPAKTQHGNGRQYPISTLPRFLEEAQLLHRLLAQLDDTDLARRLGTGPALTAASRQRLVDMQFPPTPAVASQALFTFSGEAFKAMASAGYSDEELAHAQKHLFILSGLYGLLRPLDLIQPYRLEMATPLAPAGATSLGQFWRERLTDELAQAMGRGGELVNLASQEYARAIDFGRLPGAVVSISFRQGQGKEAKSVPIHAKAGRGMMVDFLIRNRLTRAEQLQGFTLAGYRFDQELSTAGEWIFTRPPLLRRARATGQSRRSGGQ
jgi:uncharacterized protein